MTGTLYIVSTPIGNLGDISYRAVETLRNVDFIAAEDTRVTRKLLEHLKIKKQLVSYYEQNRRESSERIISRVLSGESCALVSDAGTPGISDPGEELVRLCAESGIPANIIPGPCAAISAVALSGLSTRRFSFEGFLSTSKKSRFEHLYDLKTEKRTMVFYEAPHKLKRTLTDMIAVFGDRRVSISRELTKIHEETIRCSLIEALAHFEQNAPRGEFVLVIEGTNDTRSSEFSLAQAGAIASAYINEGLSVMDAVKKAAKETGIKKNALYKVVIADN